MDLSVLGPNILKQQGLLSGAGIEPATSRPEAAALTTVTSPLPIFCTLGESCDPGKWRRQREHRRSGKLLRFVFIDWISYLVFLSTVGLFLSQAIGQTEYTSV